ncbi:MAG TPA: MlaE family lipid ABC transporter permease subunit [Methylocystis sp.]|nr:MlaE family lipid ABC transporter permease subunit [Methylocystis sp.]
MAAKLLLDSVLDDGLRRILAAGPWTVAHAASIEGKTEAAKAKMGDATTVEIDVSGIVELDTYGSWLIERLIRDLKARNISVGLIGVPERFRDLLHAVHRCEVKSLPAPPQNPILAQLESLGEGAARFGEDLVRLIELLGALGFAAARTLLSPRSFRLTSAAHHLDRVGWQALPIIFLITFLIGGIIAQQGFFHFRKFGAGDYVVDLVGILVLREIGVLIVTIMVAGRSGSSYTAELGSMKMREEIDALLEMGLDPVAVLMLPRIVALVIALPALAFVGSMSALYGGGLIAWLYGDMSPEIYIARLREAVSVTHFEVGMIKAPFMALVIGLVACSEGLQVEGSAESLGLKTTASVVKSIFLVIVLDGFFAIFFASIGM